MSDAKSPVTYGSYLKLDQLLAAQSPVSVAGGKPAHDEMLFIIVHQVYELWFKEMLHELDSVLEMFDKNFVDERNIGIAVSRLHRIIEIQKLLIEQINVIETMTPLDFLDFRSQLLGASGFQSVQFRTIENKLGLKPEQRLQYGNRPYHADLNSKEKTLVQAQETGPTLFAVIEKWLERTPFLAHGSFNFLTTYKNAFERMLKTERSALEGAGLSKHELEIKLTAASQTEKYVQSMLDETSYNAQRQSGAVRLSYKAFLAALFINLYRDQPILHLPFKLLVSVLEVDEYLNLWRYRHVLMVSRMLGGKMGSGGSSGTDYLRATVDRHRVFSDLFNLATLLIPRSELPELGPEITRNLGFYFSAKGG